MLSFVHQVTLLPCGYGELQRSAVSERKDNQVMIMTEEQQAQLQHFRDQQQRLLDILQQIANSANLSEIVSHILSGISDAIGADCTRLYVASADVRTHAFGIGPLAEVGSAADAGLLAMANEYGIVRVDGESAPLDLSSVPAEIVSLVALPVQARGTVHGVLWVGFGYDTMLGDADLVVLNVMANQAAIAIANARSLEVVRQRQEWFAAVLAHTPDPVLVVDRELRLRLANPATQELFTSINREAIGLRLNEIDEVRDLARLFASEDDDEDEGWDGDTPSEFQMGEDRTFTVSISEVTTEEGGQSGWVLVLQDVTRFKRLHDNMSDFLSTVSHDMRTPLTYMKGYLDMMGMVGELNEKQRTFVGKIAAGFIQMSDMVEKILKAGRLDPMTGTYRLEREPCDMIEVFNEVVNGLAGPAQEKGLALTPSVDGGVPVLNVDRGLIISAFTNLAENAVKYTPEGGNIEIALGVDNNDLLFRVTDDGFGISAENQHKLFRRNVRVHRKEWKRVKGSGLGLFIVKNVAQLHGGDTWVESAEGQGSTFYFSVPLEGANLVGGDS